MAKDVIITPSDGDIQFENSTGTEAGKIEQSGDDLVLSNAVGDILIGDGTADVYIGDGAANVDIVFEQNGSIRGEAGSSVDITLGSSDTDVIISGSTFNIDPDTSFAGTIDAGAITSTGKITGTELEGTSLDINGNADISGKLKVGNYWDNSTLSGNSIYVQNATDGFAFGVGTGISTWFSYSNTGGQNRMIDVDNDGTYILLRTGNVNRVTVNSSGATVAGELEATSLDINGAATFDTDVNSGGFIDHKNSNAGNAAYTSLRIQSDVGGAEIWRNSSTRTQTGGAAQSFNIYNSQDTNIWSGGTRALHLDASQNATFAGTIDAGAITSTGKITGTELEGTSLDINGNADISGNLNVGDYVHWDLSAGDYSGDPRAVTMGYSGGNYGQFGYNIEFTTTSGTHNRVFNDIPTRVDLHRGIRVFTSTAGTGGTAISWTDVLRAQDNAFQYKGNNIYYVGNDSGILNSNVTDFVSAANGGTFAGDLTINSSLYVKGANERIYMNGGGATDWRGVEVNSSGLWSWGETGTGNYFSKSIGIGETSPDAKLHIVDDTQFVSGQASVEVLKLQRKNTGGDIKATTEGHISMWATDSNNDTEWGRISWVNDNAADGGLETEGAMSFWTSREGTLTRAMYIDHDQKVGIGTTSPDEKLHVEGSGIFGENANGRVVVSDDWMGGELGIMTEDEQTIGVIYPSQNRYSYGGNYGSEPLNIDSNSGNVGIGTTSPSSPLEVYGSGSTVLDIQGSQGQLFSITDNLSGDLFTVSDISGVPIFNVNASGISYFDDKVGIGETSPSHKLDINQGELRISNNQLDPKIILQGTDMGRRWVLSQDEEDNIGSTGFYIAEGTSVDANDALLYLTPSGNLGIGTTSPTAKLQLGDYPSNNIDITTYPDVPSEHMIHITAPETTNRYGGGISFGESAFTAANITVQDAGGNGSLHMLFGTRNTSGIVAERMRIEAGGNVGIGGISPSYSLDVGGKEFALGGAAIAKYDSSNDLFKLGDWDGAGAALAIYDEQSAEVVRIKDGKVGIGTTSPASKLQIGLGTGTGSDGIFIKGEFAGGTAIVNSKNPFISLGTSTSAGYTSTIYLGANATATDQDSKIEFNKSNNALSIYYKGQGTYREHVRFGDPGNSTPKSIFFGNVGIGTTSPSTLLHTKTLGANTVPNELRIESRTTSGYGGESNINLYTSTYGNPGIYFGNQAAIASQPANIKYTGSSNLLHIETDGSFQISRSSSIKQVITSNKTYFINNNVGIHSTAPSTELEVGGTTTTENLAYKKPTSDNQFRGEIVTFGSQSGIAQGDIVAYNSSGQWVKAQANSGTTSKNLLGVAMGTIATAGILLRGFVRDASFGNQIPSSGQHLYLSTSTSGDYQTAVPSTAGHIARIIGYSVDPTNEEIYFCPDNTFVEIA